MSVDALINTVALVVGVIGFVVSLVYFLRSKKKDRAESVAASLFIFLQCAMWGVEIVFVIMVFMRLTHHGVGVVQ